MDLIGKIYPPSSKKHAFIIVATDYFTKWVEAQPMTNVSQTDVIKFIERQIIHRFGIPETITADQGTMFTGNKVKAFIQDYGIRLIHSSPYYAQANGQAEATNKVLIDMIKRTVEDQPRKWHEALSTVLWAYRNTKNKATGLTPFRLTYGQDAVLPMEINVKSLRVAKQAGLQPDEYSQAMFQELESADDDRIMALESIKLNKEKVAKSYNKKVKRKQFAEGDIVWKTILPIGTKNPEFGKWSPN